MPGGQQHSGVDRQIGQKPEVVPRWQAQAGARLAKAVEAAEVQAQKVQVAAGIAHLLLHLKVGLRRHHDRHAKEQGQQQALRALTAEPHSTQHQTSGQTRDHKQQTHAPRVGEPHPRLQRSVGAGALEVEWPGHIDHAHVVQHQQAESFGHRDEPAPSKTRPPPCWSLRWCGCGPAQRISLSEAGPHPHRHSAPDPGPPIARDTSCLASPTANMPASPPRRPP